MGKFIFVLLLAVGTPYGAHAWNVGVGTLVPNFLAAQTSTDGGRRLFQVTPTLLLGGALRIWDDQYIAPRLGYATYFGEKDETSKSDLLISYHMATRLAEPFMLYYGFSTFITSLKGKGGTTELQNGSSTSTFYVPEEKHTSYTSSLDVGAEFLLPSHWSARMDFFITRFLSSDRRKLNYLISANYHF